MRLGELMATLEGATLLRGSADTQVTSVEIDSRAVGPGALFCCVTGSRDDGHLHAAEALEAGAVALLTEHDLAGPLPFEVAEIRVPAGGARAACGRMSAAICGSPGSQLVMIGVTGTNGKTTVVSLLSTLLEEGGFAPTMIGTLTGERTTPPAPELNKLLARAAASAEAKGLPGAVAMEVSSHALDQERVAGLAFDAAIFTNLTHDHLDYHGSMEAYFDAKATLFDERTAHAVIWIETEHGRRLAARRQGPLTQVGWHSIEDLEVTSRGARFDWRGQGVALGLIGRANVVDAVLAAEAAVVVGLAPEVVARGLDRLTAVRGRMERVAGPVEGPTVLVDYAHTPDALAAALEICRSLAGDARVVVVFGCGGDRDQLKRPIMGQLAAQGADLVVITTDNPRSEDPALIASAILEGATGPATVLMEPDRARAIALAIEAAAPADVVLVAGKGHELTQVFAAEVVDFDDVTVAASVLNHLGKGG